MRSFAVSAAIAAALLAALASSASAQTTLSQWNFNSTVAGAFGVPSSGVLASGTVLGFGAGSGYAIPLGSVITTGAATDPGTVITGTTYNRAVSFNPPLISVSNSSVGLMFQAPTTGMNPGDAVKLSWSQTVGFRSSRYWQLLTSTSGTAGTFSVPAGGIGSNISQFVTGLNSGTSQITGTATVNVSSSGVIDFRTINGNWISQSVTSNTSSSTNPAIYANGFVDNISFTLPTGQGYENNPNFAFAIVGLWDPSLSATSGTTGLVSSFAGTDSTDLVNGYSRALASGGSVRLDLVTVSAVPEPTTWAMLGASATIGGSLVWRRRRRSEA